MAAELGVSAASVSRQWRANGLKPRLVRGFKVSRDPRFVEKLEDVVGLCQHRTTFPQFRRSKFPHPVAVPVLSR